MKIIFNSQLNLSPKTQNNTPINLLSSQIKIQNQPQKDIVTFSGNSQNEETHLKPSGELILSKEDYKKIQKLKNEIQGQNSNILPIGKGANSKVYEIPTMPDFVLKILKEKDKNNIDTKEFPRGVNLGQVVWIDPKDDKTLILKKVNGKPHSLENWSDIILNKETNMPDKVTQKNAEIFFSKVEEIAKMDQKAFDHLAYEIKTLDDLGYKVDCINPNNLLVDNEKQTIHIIDYFKVKEKEKHLYKNSYLDMPAIMLDFALYPEYIDNLSEENQGKLKAYTKAINTKCYLAAKNEGLTTDTKPFETYMLTTSRWFTAHSVTNEKTGKLYPRYYDVRCFDFIKMLNDEK